MPNLEIKRTSQGCKSLATNPSAQNIDGRNPVLDAAATERLLEASNSLAMVDYQRRLFYVVDWLPPDFGAVGQYALLFGREIAKTGRMVSLIGLTTGARQKSSENCDTGVLEIKWVPAKRYNKSGLISRLVWSLHTNLRLIWEVIRDPRSQGAQILFTGSPPFMLFFAVFTKWLRRARLIYRITDFYPEVLIAALGKRSLPLVLFEKLTWWFRRRVDAFQVLGEDQRRLLVAGGIAPERITLKRDIPPIPITGNEVPALRPSVLSSRKVLLYSGNYGVAHEIDTVVEGFIQHHNAGGPFGFWLNASGSGLKSIVGRLHAAKIPLAQTEPVPLDQLPALLAAADAHLITLRMGFAGLVLPSKIYACLSSGRPILFVGPKSSDVHLLCTEVGHPGYEQVDPGDVDGFARALARLAQ
jgi:glycosyltransferase involved in cell wall biosynthesis